MKIFNSIGHFFAWIFSKVAAGAQAVATVDQGPLAQAIASLLGSKGEEVQASIQAIAGDVLKSFGAAGAAIGASGLNVEFDTATIQAIEQLYRDLAGLFGKSNTAATPAKAS